MAPSPPSAGTTETPPTKAIKATPAASPNSVPTVKKDPDKPRVARDPLAPFATDIMQKVIKPIIAELVAANPGKDDDRLHELFKEKTKSCVALSKFRGWLKDCGFVQSWVSK